MGELSLVKRGSGEALTEITVERQTTKTQMKVYIGPSDLNTSKTYLATINWKSTFSNSTKQMGLFIIYDATSGWQAHGYIASLSDVSVREAGLLCTSAADYPGYILMYSNTSGFEFPDPAYYPEYNAFLFEAY